MSYRGISNKLKVFHDELKTLCTCFNHTGLCHAGMSTQFTLSVVIQYPTDDKLFLTSVSPWPPGLVEWEETMAASLCANAACSNPATAGHCVETELRGEHTEWWQHLFSLLLLPWYINTTRQSTLFTLKMSQSIKKTRSVLLCKACMRRQMECGRSAGAPHGKTKINVVLFGLWELIERNGVWFADVSGEKGISEPQEWLTCSLMCVQADELHGALVWCSAGFTVLYMLSPRTVPEGMAVSY